jgi:hypothetical protein
MRTMALNRGLTLPRLESVAVRRVIALSAAAIAIRLVFMPFTLHGDAYAIYSRAHEAAYHNQWFGFTSQIVIQSLHNFWLLLIRPLLPDSAGIWSDTSSILGVGGSEQQYRDFLAYHHIYRALFLMKLPYVVADLGCAWVLTRLVAPARRLAVAAFWLLNPLVIYSSAIWGRHDSIAILLMLLSIVVARRATDTSRLVGLGLLGLATLTRFFPVIIVPAFLLAFRRSARQLWMFIGLLAGMVVLVEAAGLMTSGRSALLTMIRSYPHYQYWLAANFNLGMYDAIFVFPVVYVIGLLWAIERGIAPDEVPLFGAIAFLLLFALTFFHPHYAIWLVPFLALTIATSGRMIAYHAIQVVCILVYTAQWGLWTTWGLLAPVLGSNLDLLPVPIDIIAAQVRPQLVFGLFRSILTAVSIWMIWQLVRPLVRRA